MCRYKGHMPNKYMHYNKSLALLQLHEAVLNKEIIQLKLLIHPHCLPDPPENYNTYSMQSWLRLKVKSMAGEQNKANCTIKGVNLWYQLN